MLAKSVRRLIPILENLEIIILDIINWKNWKSMVLIQGPYKYKELPKYLSLKYSSRYKWDKTTKIMMKEFKWASRQEQV
jgi:hypothetical protein